MLNFNLKDAPGLKLGRIRYLSYFKVVIVIDYKQKYNTE